eukprot:360913_1
MHRAYSYTKPRGMNPKPWKTAQSALAQIERIHISVVLDFPHVLSYPMKRGKLTIFEFDKQYDIYLDDVEFMSSVHVYIDKINLSQFSSYDWRKCFAKDPNEIDDEEKKIENETKNKNMDVDTQINNNEEKKTEEEEKKTKNKKKTKNQKTSTNTFTKCCTI